MDNNQDKDWERVSKALFAAVPERVSPGFKERVLANLEPRRLPLSWLAPAFAAAAVSLFVLLSATAVTPVSAEEFLLDEEPALLMEVE
jgi:hypothetical protein